MKKTLRAIVAAGMFALLEAASTLSGGGITTVGDVAHATEEETVTAPNAGVEPVEEAGVEHRLPVGIGEAVPEPPGDPVVHDGGELPAR